MAEASTLLTIVTPSYNQGRFIRRTIESVLSQDYSPVEYLVMDGGSTDNSASVAQEYSDRLTWTSEPDKGQSDAINKGFQRGRGDVVAWLNADDTYCPGAFSRVMNFFAEHPDVMMVYGEGLEIDEDDNLLHRFPATQPFDLWKLIHVWDYILQPTVFIRKHALQEVGLLDVSLNWSMDWDLWIRVGLRYEVAYLPDVLACSRIHADTKTSTGGFKRFRELVGLMRSHGLYRFPPGYFIYGSSTLKSLAMDRCPRACGAVLKRLLTPLDRLTANMINGPHAWGVHQDGWVSRKGKFMVRSRSGTKSVLQIYGTTCFPGQGSYPLLLETRTKPFAGRSQQRIAAAGPFIMDVPLPHSNNNGEWVEVTISCSKDWSPAETGLSADTRRFSWRLEKTEIVEISQQGA